MCVWKIAIDFVWGVSTKWIYPNYYAVRTIHHKQYHLSVSVSLTINSTIYVTFHLASIKKTKDVF